MRMRALAAATVVGSILVLGAASSARAQNPPPPPAGTEAPGSTAAPPAPLSTPADRPLLPERINPALTFEGGAGVLGYLGGTAGIGPSWNLRVTGHLTPRFAVEGNYTGSANRRSDQTGTLVYTSVDGDVRYNILLPDQAFVQPYVAGGIGYVGYIGPGGDLAAMTIPLGAGAERLLTPTIKVGARFNVRPAFFEDLSQPGSKSKAGTGGSTWDLLAHVGGAF